ncbi:MAG: hypothetical protein JNJ85_07215 [Candidatus Kapabacteria bacterium]|nr:hypothetical protein [Candidatus Kapabacteria bacterium]
MSLFWQYVVSGMYVAFVYAVLAFGALAYRQIIDNQYIKTISLGEERYLLFDPRVFVVISVLFLFFSIFVAIIISTKDVYYADVHNTVPGLIYFVIPAVCIVSAVQLYLRAYWQRTSVRTGGIIIRRMLTEDVADIPFEDITKIHVQRESLWCVVLFYTDSVDVFAMCRVSGKGLDKLLNTINGYTHCIVEIEK